jgi:heat shock protein HslJ
VTFAAESIGGSVAGCNAYGSEYTVSDAGYLTIQSISVTEMFCGKPDGIMQQEKEYLDLLQTVIEYTIERNNLILKTSDDRELVFNKMVL